MSPNVIIDMSENLFTKSFTFIHTADLHQGPDFSAQKWKNNIYQRANDFLENFKIIIARSLQLDIDLLVIAGDLFDRSKPNPIIRQIIIDNLVKVSKVKPVLVIPGNHDRSKFSKGLLFIHSNLHIYNKPTIDKIIIKDITLTITAIPFLREKKLETINEIITRNLKLPKTDFNLLMFHELVESCKVGITNFEFTKNMKDVVPIDMIDEKFDYIALGHVHKYQQIPNSKTPIFYSGSVERTSVVEREEEKGFIIVKVIFNKTNNVKVLIPTFQTLPARKIIYYKIESLQNFSLNQMIQELNQLLISIDKAPLVNIRIMHIDNYSIYKEIKEYLKNLKSSLLIFDFQLSSPDFTFKLKSESSSRYLVES